MIVDHTKIFLLELLGPKALKNIEIHKALVQIRAGNGNKDVDEIMKKYD